MITERLQERAQMRRIREQVQEVKKREADRDTYFAEADRIVEALKTTPILAELGFDVETAQGFFTDNYNSFELPASICGYAQIDDICLNTRIAYRKSGTAYYDKLSVNDGLEFTLVWQD